MHSDRVGILLLYYVLRYTYQVRNMLEYILEVSVICKIFANWIFCRNARIFLPHSLPSFLCTWPCHKNHFWIRERRELPQPPEHSIVVFLQLAHEHRERRTQHTLFTPIYRNAGWSSTRPTQHTFSISASEGVCAWAYSWRMPLDSLDIIYRHDAAVVVRISGNCCHWSAADNDRTFMSL